MTNILFFLIKQIFYVSFVKSNAFPNTLSREEEALYLEQFSKGDMNAREKLINHNLRLVAHIVKKYDSGKDLTEDLISIGTIGLIKAIDSYSIENNVKLATYAAKCIENEILMHLRTGKKTSLDISLNESIGQDKDGTDITLMDITPIENKDMMDSVVLNDNIRAIYQYIDVLDEREKEIIYMRYGLNQREELTQKQIAKKYNISRSYVSRIEKRALMKLLREFIKAEKKEK